MVLKLLPISTQLTLNTAASRTLNPHTSPTARTSSGYCSSWSAVKRNTCILIDVIIWMFRSSRWPLNYWRVETLPNMFLVRAAFAFYYCLDLLFFFFHELSSCQWSCEHGGPQRLKAKLYVWCIIDLMAESAGIQTQTHTQRATLHSLGDLVISTIFC